jgi:hypothetical protein
MKKLILIQCIINTILVVGFTVKGIMSLENWWIFFCIVFVPALVVNWHMALNIYKRK